MPKTGNHWFATYYIHHEKKFWIKKSIYDPCHLYKFGSFDIIKMQINDILILAYNNFANMEEVEIKATKIMTKD